jgi:hypothetical protein
MSIEETVVPGWRDRRTNHRHRALVDGFVRLPGLEGCCGTANMNALLVYPKWPDTYWSFKHALPFQGKRSSYPPLGLLTIAALLPTHWVKRLVDTNVRALKDSDLAWADVALVSGMLVQKDNLLVILARCRASGIRAQAQD